MKKHHDPFEVKNHPKSYLFGMALFGTILFAGLILALNGQAWSMDDQTRSAIIDTMPVVQSDQAAVSSTSNTSPGDFIRQLTTTVTTTVNLPIVQYDFVNQRQLGQVQMLSGPTACDGQDCYQLRVSCPYLAQTDDLTIKVGEPISSTLTGTIIFASGWDGTYYWDVAGLNLASFADAQESANIPSLAVLGNNADIIQHLRTTGYRTIQLKWTNNWFKATLGVAEGIANLACRPATVAQWIYDNFHSPNTNLPYCAVGHSNGASQFGYSVSQYGEFKLFSAVIYESGPNWSRIDTACLHDDPAHQDLYGDINERKTNDWGFGFKNDGSGACAMMDVDYKPDFQSSSLALGAWPYNYPNLKIGFIFGGADTVTTAAEGKYYRDFLINAGSPNVTSTVVPGAGHFVTTTPEGAQAVEDTILNLCQ